MAPPHYYMIRNSWKHLIKDYVWIFSQNFVLLIANNNTVSGQHFTDRNLVTMVTIVRLEWAQGGVGQRQHGRWVVYCSSVLHFPTYPYPHVTSTAPLRSIL